MRYKDVLVLIEIVNSATEFELWWKSTHPKIKSFCPQIQRLFDALEKNRQEGKDETQKEAEE